MLHRVQQHVLVTAAQINDYPLDMVVTRVDKSTTMYSEEQDGYYKWLLANSAKHAGLNLREEHEHFQRLNQGNVRASYPNRADFEMQTGIKGYEFLEALRGKNPFNYPHNIGRAILEQLENMEIRKNRRSIYPESDTLNPLLLLLD